MQDFIYDSNIDKILKIKVISGGKRLKKREIAD